MSHTQKEGINHLVIPQSYDSWLTLLEAAKVRDHSPILEIAKQLKENEVRKIFYHRGRRIQSSRCREIWRL